MEWAHRNILYSGTGLAGVSTSVQFIARAKGSWLKNLTPLEVAMTTRLGATVQIRSDVRSSYYFENTVAAISRCAAAGADAHMIWLRPQLAAHREYLKVIDGIVFVVDSQPERVEANLERLERLTTDLASVCRDPPSVPLVFQCNKRDLPRALAILELGSRLRWPRCEFAPSVANTGEGVMEALGVLLDLVRRSPAGRPPYR